jgi:alanine-glyoxylate transaminase/serine-glyoxylate transaminase/serine-pyruvate transaminase
MVPQGIDGADVIDAAFRRYNLALGAGVIPENHIRA